VRSYGRCVAAKREAARAQLGQAAICQPERIAWQEFLVKLGRECDRALSLMRRGIGSVRRVSAGSSATGFRVRPGGCSVLKRSFRAVRSVGLSLSCASGAIFEAPRFSMPAVGADGLAKSFLLWVAGLR